MLKILHNAISFLLLNFLIILISQNAHEDRTPVLKFPSRSHPMSNDPHASSPLTQWLQTRLGSLYESVPPVEEADFNALFQSAFSDDASIYVNHEQMSQETFLTRLHSYNAAITRATVEWKEVIEATPKEGEQHSAGGIVAGFFVVTRSMKFRIRVGPAQRLSFNSFSAKIDENPDAQPGPDGTRLRITQLFITSVDKAAPIHLQGIVAPHDT
ncbi:hypothetical protein BDZ97DRAFT_1845699 [Flammula alnicola]|nr:hypothetical protein BDZ97DRAFT_1845699 [Flammula alnicola]